MRKDYDPTKVEIPIRVFNDRKSPLKYISPYIRGEKKMVYTHISLSPMLQEQLEDYIKDVNNYGINLAREFRPDAAENILLDIMAGMEIELVPNEIDGLHGLITVRNGWKRDTLCELYAPTSLIHCKYSPERMVERARHWEGYEYSTQGEIDRELTRVFGPLIETARLN